MAPRTGSTHLPVIIYHDERLLMIEELHRLVTAFQVQEDIQYLSLSLSALCADELHDSRAW